MDSAASETIACIAEGQLWLWNKGVDALQPVRSQFGEDLKERLLKMRQKNEWKTQGNGSGPMSGGALWGANSGGDGTMHVSITAIAACDEDSIFFVMHADDLCGIFSYKPDGDDEQRLYHGTEFTIHTIDYSHAEESLICSVSGGDGVHNLALVTPNKGGGIREITEGDSLDTYPRWIPGKREAVFQSAGIGRNRDGLWVETAPCQISKIDFADGSMTSLVEDDRYDFLLPHMDAHGNLYCIRRPYEAARKTSVGTAIKDVALLPWRLLQAGFGFLNVFSSMFTGKPLTSAGAPRASTPDAKRLILYGNLVDAEKVTRENADLGDDELKASVPRSWELVRFKGTSDPEVLAKAVMAFTVSPEGEIAYSNGSALFRIEQTGGSPERLTKRRFIQQIALVPTRT